VKDKNLVVFGDKDFSICDKANKIKGSVTNINYTYYQSKLSISGYWKVLILNLASDSMEMMDITF
jgi:hypothetical protein